MQCITVISDAENHRQELLPMLKTIGVDYPYAKNDCEVCDDLPEARPYFWVENVIFGLIFQYSNVYTTWNVYIIFSSKNLHEDYV